MVNLDSLPVGPILCFQAHNTESYNIGSERKQLTCHINVKESAVEHVVARCTAPETGPYLETGLNLSP